MPQKTSSGSFEKQFRMEWLDALPTPIFILDHKGKFVFCNKAVEALTGHTREIVIGTGLDLYIAQADSQRFLRDMLKLFRNTPLLRVKYDILRRNKKLIHVEADLSPIVEEENKDVRFIIGIVLASKHLS